MAGQLAVWESGLESVVVHAVGAVCRRRASGVLPADGRVRVTGLPRLAAEGSLRVRVLSGGARVVEARVEHVESVREEDESPAWERELKELGAERDRLVERQERLDARIREVAALRPVSPQRRRDEGLRRAPADAVLELAEFVDARLAVLHERAVELAQQVASADHAFDVASVRARQRSSADQPGGVESSARAVVTVRGAGPVELEVEYAVPGAVWVPTYQLAHRRGERAARLTLRASVAQRTGEDWSGVRLALSTADLARPSGLPRLSSLRIGRRQPAPAPSGWRAQPAGLDELFADWVGAQASKPVPEGPRAIGAVPVAAAAPAPVAPKPGRPAGGGASAKARPAGFGAAPSMQPRSMPAPAAPQGPPPAGAPAEVMAYGGAVPAPFMAEPSADAAADLAEPAVPAGPRPSADQLDYAGLVLAGAQEESFRRGRLFPRGESAAAGALRGAEAVGGLPLPVFAVRPRESAGSFDHRFDAAAPAEIPSDGVWHTVAVAELPVEVATRYVCVPSVEEAVYAVLELANGTAHALLAGPVEVSVDGGFLTTAALPTLAPGGVREVGLGRAEEVRVARHTEVRESTSGVLNSTAVLDHQVRIELVNRLPHDAPVEVRERVPVSGDAEVRVEERPGWSPPEEPTAQLPSSARIRRVVVPAGGSTELTGGYVIRIPAGKAVVGGNRRS
ncbi:DUF4139 domain-containing protein [Kitasatospora sp. CB02891]|uniref:DUF4139 domain-containing protein n=1 Tax=Kitasatospora sp. CB02891 TaxID=2020329 RepID=UPI001E606044|nr:DUF4139 domain-containing protein [Kitasatospora sp. CB02891]